MEGSPAYTSLYNDSMKVPLDESFQNPVYSTTFHDYEPPSKIDEDDHQYDIIPAALPDYDNVIQKSVVGSPLVDDSNAKTDSVHQS